MELACGLTGNISVGAVEHLPLVSLLGHIAGEGRVQHQVVHVHQHVIGLELQRAGEVVHVVGARGVAQRVDAARPAVGSVHVVAIVVLAHAREVSRLQAGGADVAGHLVLHVHLGQVVHRGVHVEGQLDAVAHLHAGLIGHQVVHRAVIGDILVHNGAALLAGIGRFLVRLGHGHVIALHDSRVLGHPVDLVQSEGSGLAHIRGPRAQVGEVTAVLAVRAVEGVVVDHGPAVVGHGVVFHLLHHQLHAVGALGVHVLIGGVGLGRVPGGRLVPVNLQVLGQVLGRDIGVPGLLQVLLGHQLVEHRVVQLAFQVLLAHVLRLGHIGQGVLVPHLLAGDVAGLLGGIGVVGRLGLFRRLEGLGLEAHHGAAALDGLARRLALVLLGQQRVVGHGIAVGQLGRARRAVVGRELADARAHVGVLRGRARGHLRHVDEVQHRVLVVGVGEGHVHLGLGRPGIRLLGGARDIGQRQVVAAGVLIAGHAQKRHIIQREGRGGVASGGGHVVVGPAHTGHVAEHVAVGRVALARQRAVDSGVNVLAVLRGQLVVGHPRAVAAGDGLRGQGHDALGHRLARIQPGAGQRRLGSVPVGHVVFDLQRRALGGLRRPVAGQVVGGYHGLGQLMQVAVGAVRAFRQQGRAARSGARVIQHRRLAVHKGAAVVSGRIGGLLGQLEVAHAVGVAVGVEARGALGRIVLGAHERHGHGHGGLVPRGVADVRHHQAHAIAVGVGQLVAGRHRVHRARAAVAGRVVELGQDAHLIRGVPMEQHAGIVVRCQLREAIEEDVPVVVAVLQQRGVALHAVVATARRVGVGAGDVALLARVGREGAAHAVVAVGRAVVVVHAVLGETVQRGHRGVEVRLQGLALVAGVVAMHGPVHGIAVVLGGLQLVGHLGDHANPHAATGIDLAGGSGVVLVGVAVQLAHTEGEHAVVVVLLNAVFLGQVGLLGRVGHRHGTVGGPQVGLHRMGRAQRAVGLLLSGRVVLHPLALGGVVVLLHFPAHDALALGHFEAAVHLL